MAIRHSITLSTTEPNNEIGVIKIRQADEQTQTLDVQITENGVPKSYQGLAVYFCAKLGQTAGLGIIEQKLKPEEMTNPANGKLEYTMRAEDWQISGRQKGYFSFRKMKNEHEFIEQFTTRDFTFEVIKSVYSDGLKEVKKDGSTYVWTIEDMLRLFDEYIASGKTDWEEFVEQNREILESVDPGGKILGEIAEVTAQLAQSERGPSFVQKLLDSIKVHSMYVRKNESNRELFVGVNLEDTERSCIEYRFVYNSDDLLLLRGVSTGFCEGIDNLGSIITLNGVFNTTSQPVTYTTEIGANFTFSFIGDSLEFSHRVENRGGIWEFRTDDGKVSHVSCYNPDTKNIVTDVFDNLEYKNHNVKATFLGEDPLHPLASETPRGYLFYNADNTANTVRVPTKNQKRKMDVSTKIEIVSSNSIPDFAINARIKDASYSSMWVPQHGSENNVSKRVNSKIRVNGVNRSDKAGVLPTQEIEHDVEHFEILQSFSAHNNNDLDNRLWWHSVSHTISKDKPFLSIQNGMDISRAVQISDMYLTMLPVKTSTVKKLVLNNGEVIEPIPSDGSQILRGRNVSSAMFVGNYELGRGHACAIDVLSYPESTNFGNSPFKETPCRITFREDDVTKFYLRSFVGEARVGDRFTNNQRIIVTTNRQSPLNNFSNL